MNVSLIFLFIIRFHSFLLFFAYFFPQKNQYFHERIDCERMQQMQRKENNLNELTTTGLNEKRKKIKKIKTKQSLAFERQKRDEVVVLVVTWTLYTSLSRCLDVVVVVLLSFKSHQRVFHTMPTTYCVLRKLRWRLLKQMTFTF